MTLTQVVRALEFTRADRMRKALKVAGIGVGELAERMEVSRNTVSRWINDEAQPRRRDLRMFAEMTNVPLSWLEDGTFDEGVRPKGLEPLTFWFGAAHLVCDICGSRFHLAQECTRYDDAYTRRVDLGLCA